MDLTFLSLFQLTLAGTSIAGHQVTTWFSVEDNEKTVPAGDGTVFRGGLKVGRGGTSLPCLLI